MIHLHLPLRLHWLKAKEPFRASALGEAVGREGGGRGGRGEGEEERMGRKGKKGVRGRRKEEGEEGGETKRGRGRQPT